jgi:hypothetical protein
MHCAVNGEEIQYCRKRMLRMLPEGKDGEANRAKKHVCLAHDPRLSNWFRTGCYELPAKEHIRWYTVADVLLCTSFRFI